MSEHIATCNLRRTHFTAVPSAPFSSRDKPILQPITHLDTKIRRWCSLGCGITSFWVRWLQSRLSPLRCRMDSARLRPWGTPLGTTVAQCATMDRLGKRPAVRCPFSTPPSLYVFRNGVCPQSSSELISPGHDLSRTRVRIFRPDGVLEWSLELTTFAVRATLLVCGGVCHWAAPSRSQLMMTHG